MLKKLLHTIAIASALSLLVLAPAQADETSGKASNFTLKSNSGKNIKLSELRGQVVMLNFWASWCKPCRQEMPLLNEIYNKYHSLGFTLLGINIENSPELAKRFLADVKVDFPILYDPENQVSKAYDVNAMPTTILIDRDGKMRFLHKGYKPGYENEYRKQVRSLIRE